VDNSTINRLEEVMLAHFLRLILGTPKGLGVDPNGG
jgi:hypothetical protein